MSGKIFLTGDGECDPEIRSRIGIDKDTLQKLNRILRNRKCVPNCYLIYVLLYGSECWIIASKMKRLEARDMWFYRRM